MICSKCGRDKNEKEFNWRNETKNQRQKQCKLCTRLAVKAHYNANRQDYLDKADRERTKAKAEIRAFLLEYLLAHPCVDCGEANIVLLEFDHRGDKKFTISSELRRHPTVEKLKSEIAKCDSRCVRCHRLKTAAAHRSWRWLFQELGIMPS